MKPLEHQIRVAEECWQVMLKYKYVYLQGLPRAGKTLTAILIAEKSKRIKSVLILTPKQAIPGWKAFLNDEELLKHVLTKEYTVTNYEQAGRYVTRTESKTGKPLKRPIKELELKLNPDDYQLVIIDESHRLGKVGAPTSRYKVIAELCKDMPHIHLSGTAIVESPNSIYYQMHISKYTPFKGMDSFYDFFRAFGRPSSLWLGSREVPKYDQSNPNLLPYIENFTVRMTQDDAGISKDVQASDTIHYVELDESTRKLYNTIQKDELATVNGELLVCDSTMKLRTSLHMLEGGVLKIEDDYIFVGNLEKINFIKKMWGDKPGVGIMAHFIGERELLEKHFKHAEIYSSTSHAEGVNLAHLDHFIIYSSGYSGSKFIQRRERTVNITQTSASIVHHLICKGAISEQVYFTCSEKNNFNNETYIRTWI
jgi:hypothetical protein